MSHFEPTGALRSWQLDRASCLLIVFHHSMSALPYCLEDLSVGGVLLGILSLRVMLERRRSSRHQRTLCRARKLCRAPQWAWKIASIEASFLEVLVGGGRSVANKLGEKRDVFDAVATSSCFCASLNKVTP